MCLYRPNARWEGEFEWLKTLQVLQLENCRKLFSDCLMMSDSFKSQSAVKGGGLEIDREQRESKQEREKKKTGTATRTFMDVTLGVRKPFKKNSNSTYITTCCLGGFQEKLSLLIQKQTPAYSVIRQDWNFKWDWLLWSDETKKIAF